MASTSTSYVQKFVDDVTELPVSLQRTFTLIRELDEKAHDLKEQIQAAAQLQLSSLTAAGVATSVSGSTVQPAPGAQAPGLGDNIEAQITQLLQYQDEKVALASQVYTSVDDHIQALDNNLAALKAQLEKEQALVGSDGSKGGRPRGDGQNKKQKTQETVRSAVPRQRQGEAAAKVAAEGELTDAETPGALPDLVGQVFDINEPVYCYCQKISYGEMIGCDNGDCPIEWFHYGCVGIDPENVPESWYCTNCQKLKDAGKI